MRILVQAPSMLGKRHGDKPDLNVDLISMEFYTNPVSSTTSCVYIYIYIYIYMIYDVNIIAHVSHACMYGARAYVDYKVHSMQSARNDIAREHRIEQLCDGALVCVRLRVNIALSLKYSSVSHRKPAMTLACGASDHGSIADTAVAAARGGNSTEDNHLGNNIFLDSYTSNGYRT
jgi:hypothetical protein